MLFHNVIRENIDNIYYVNLTYLTFIYIMAKVNLDQIERALKASGGFITIAAEKLNVTHSAVSQRISKNKRLQNLVLELKEATLDLSESKLTDAINDNKSWAIMYHLDNQGERRGYGKRSKHEITGKGGQPLLATPEVKIQVEYVEAGHPGIERQVPSEAEGATESA